MTIRPMGLVAAPACVAAFASARRPVLVDLASNALGIRSNDVDKKSMIDADVPGRIVTG